MKTIMTTARERTAEAGIVARLDTIEGFGGLTLTRTKSLRARIVA